MLIIKYTYSYTINIYEAIKCVMFIICSNTHSSVRTSVSSVNPLRNLI